MNNRARITYYFAILLAFLGGTAFCHRLYCKVRAIRYITYKFDPQISPDLRQSIEKHVSRFEVDGEYQLQVILSELERLYPDVQSIAIKVLPFNTAEVEISLHNPVVKVNSQHVLAENRGIIPSHFYAQYATKRLPQVQISSIVPEIVSTEVIKAIKAGIKEHIFENYSVSMFAEQEWYLQDKNNPACTICCNPNTIPSCLVQKKCNDLIELVKKNSSPKMAWVADVRFDHQIVLSRLKGGLDYGKKK